MLGSENITVLEINYNDDLKPIFTEIIKYHHYKILTEERPLEVTFLLHRVQTRIHLNMKSRYRVRLPTKMSKMVTLIYSECGCT